MGLSALFIILLKDRHQHATHDHHDVIVYTHLISFYVANLLVDFGYRMFIIDKAILSSTGILVHHAMYGLNEQVYRLNHHFFNLIANHAVTVSSLLASIRKELVWKILFIVMNALASVLKSVLGHKDIPDIYIRNGDAVSEIPRARVRRFISGFMIESTEFHGREGEEQEPQGQPPPPPQPPLSSPSPSHEAH